MEVGEALLRTVGVGAQGVGGQVCVGVGEALLEAVGETVPVTVGVGTQVGVEGSGVEVGAGWVVAGG